MTFGHVMCLAMMLQHVDKHSLSHTHIHKHMITPRPHHSSFSGYRVNVHIPEKLLIQILIDLEKISTFSDYFDEWTHTQR